MHYYQFIKVDYLVNLLMKLKDIFPQKKFYLISQ